MQSQAYDVGGLRLPAMPDLPPPNNSGSALRQQAEYEQHLLDRFSKILAAREGDAETLRRTLFRLPVSVNLLLSTLCLLVSTTASIHIVLTVSTQSMPQVRAMLRR